jgi:hypothetical protein
MPKLDLTSEDVRLLDEFGITDPAQITRERLRGLDARMWDEGEYLTGADRPELWASDRRLKLERDALGRLLDRAERQKKRRYRVWWALGWLWLATVALVLWKLGWL